MIRAFAVLWLVAFLWALIGLFTKDDEMVRVGLWAMLVTSVPLIWSLFKWGWR